MHFFLSHTHMYVVPSDLSRLDPRSARVIHTSRYEEAAEYTSASTASLHGTIEWVQVLALIM